MRLSTISSQALLASTALAGWPAFFQPGEILEQGRRLLGRQDSNTKTSFNLSISTIQGDTGTLSKTASATGSNTAKETGSITSKATTGSDNASKTTTTPTESTFDERLGPGGISMITPNPISGTTYYKIKETVTFGWNYTSVSILPSAIDILAIGQSNSVTYTLALNQSVTATADAFTWDTDQYQSSIKISSTPLQMQTYTLVVHDAAKDISASPSAGYLGTANQFRFIMYSPQAAVDWKDWKCVTCSAASSLDRKTTGFVLGTALITALSFTWFAGVAGLF